MTDDVRAAQQALVTLRRRVDEHFDGVRRRWPQSLSCRAGCDGCCHLRLSVFTIEAARIREALQRMAVEAPERRETIRRQADDPAWAQSCPMLVEGRCGVYEDRPMICRSHGVPVRVIEDGQAEVLTCPLNFVAERETGGPPLAAVLELSAVDQPLAVMATMFDGTGERVELEDLARAAD